MLLIADLLHIMLLTCGYSALNIALITDFVNICLVITDFESNLLITDFKDTPLNQSYLDND